MRNMMFARTFPMTHPRKGEPTWFVEKVMASLADCVENWEMLNDFVLYDWHQYYNAFPKGHTIRAGNRWKVGDFFTPRVWSGRPYNSKTIQFAPPIEVKKVWEILICKDEYRLNGYAVGQPLLTKIANNDGLSSDDLEMWLSPYAKNESAVCQIICWDHRIEY